MESKGTKSEIKTLNRILIDRFDWNPEFTHRNLVSMDQKLEST